MDSVIEKDFHMTLAEAIMVPEPEPTLPWMEAELILTQRQMTRHPGPYRTDPLCPWMKGIIETADDTTAHTVAIKKGAQVQVTQGEMGLAAKRLVCDPDPQIFAQPTEDLVKNTSKLRFRPLLEDSPAAAATFTPNPNDMSVQLYQTKKTNIRLLGGNSAANLSSLPARFVTIDDADKFKDNVGKEGSPIGLLFTRTKTYSDNRQRRLNGTPTTAAGHVEKYYQLGDKRHFFVPCPKCGTHQVLIWEQIKYDDSLDAIAAGETAYYECIKCKYEIDDSEKWDMVQLGTWKATAKTRRRGFISFWISGIYSLSDDCSFASLVEKYMTVKDDPSDLKQFWNEDVGVIDEERPIGPYGKKEIFAIRDRLKFARGTVPTIRKFYMMLLADVQATSIPWTVWGMAPHDLWLVDHGLSSVLEDLPDIAEGPYTNRNDEEFPCHIQMFDSGFRTTEVYKHHMITPRSLVIKGDTGKITTTTAPIRFQQIDRMPNGDKLPKGKGVMLHHLHPRFFRDELGTLLQPLSDDDDYATFPLRLWFHEEIDRDFIDQLLGEMLLSEKKADRYGRKRTYWKKIGRKNDYFDLCHYALAMRWLFRRDLDKLAKAEARELKDLLSGKGKQNKPSAKKRRRIRESFFDPDSLQI